MAEFLGNAKFSPNVGHPAAATLRGDLFFFGGTVDLETGKARDRFAAIVPGLSGIPCAGERLRMISSLPW